MNHTRFSMCRFMYMCRLAYIYICMNVCIFVYYICIHLGRGIFYNEDKTFLVWVNEEDHLRIISMQKGGDLASVYDRMVKAVTKIGEKFAFSRHQRIGFLTFCPTNLGTNRQCLSVHIRLVLKFSADDKKTRRCSQYL